MQLSAVGLSDSPGCCLVWHLHSICAGLPARAGPLVSHKPLEHVAALYLVNTCSMFHVSINKERAAQAHTVCVCSLCLILCVCRTMCAACVVIATSSWCTNSALHDNAELNVLLALQGLFQCACLGLCNVLVLPHPDSANHAYTYHDWCGYQKDTVDLSNMVITVSQICSDALFQVLQHTALTPVPNGILAIVGLTLLLARIVCA